MKKFVSFHLILFLAVTLLFTGCERKKEDTRAILRINSTPAGAAVTLLNQEQGKTPYGCRIRAGNYLVKLTRPGYYPVWKTVSLKPGEKAELNATLEPETASVLFETQPSGAAIHFNNKLLGETPFTLRNLPHGKYSALVKLAGYSPQTVTWEVSDPRPRMIKTELVSNVGSISVESTPSAASVFLNGAPSGTTPYKTRLEQGKYTVKITKAGYTVYEQAVLVSREQVSYVKAALEPLPGTLIIRTVPANAQIRINDRDYGTAPVNAANLPRGEYRITATAPGYDPAETTVNLPAGKTVERVLSLTSNTGGIDFVTYPPGITVYLDGRELGSTLVDKSNPDISEVFSIRDLKPGKHTLILAHKQARPNRKRITVTVEKGKIERLNTLQMWIANCTLKLKTGSVMHGRFVAEQGKDKVLFEPEPGITYTYKRSEIESITPLKREE